jgi:hypothetical protein
MLSWSIVPCPACERPIEILNPRLGKELMCPHCEELVVITSLEPLELSSALDEEAKAVSVLRTIP